MCLLELDLCLERVYIHNIINNNNNITHTRIYAQIVFIKHSPFDHFAPPRRSKEKEKENNEKKRSGTSTTTTGK